MYPEQAGATAVRAYFAIRNAADGTFNDSLVAGSAGLTVEVWREGTSSTTTLTAPTLTPAANRQATWSANSCFRPMRGLFWVDVPDSLHAGGSARWFGRLEATGIIGELVRTELVALDWRAGVPTTAQIAAAAREEMDANSTRLATLTSRVSAAVGTMFGRLVGMVTGGNQFTAQALALAPGGEQAVVTPEVDPMQQRSGRYRITYDGTTPIARGCDLDAIFRCEYLGDDGNFAHAAAPQLAGAQVFLSRTAQPATEISGTRQTISALGGAAHVLRREYDVAVVAQLTADTWVWLEIPGTIRLGWRLPYVEAQTA